ncbi:MAG: hypothetical protein ABSH36_04905 [Solirubrobacteraceae bacterium]
MDDKLWQLMLGEEGLAQMGRALGITAAQARALVEASRLGPAGWEDMDARARKLLGKPLMECNREDWEALDEDAYAHLLTTYGTSREKLGGELDRFLGSLLESDNP